MENPTDMLVLMCSASMESAKYLHVGSAIIYDLEIYLLSLRTGRIRNCPSNPCPLSSIITSLICQ